LRIETVRPTVKRLRGAIGEATPPEGRAAREPKIVGLRSPGFRPCDISGAPVKLKVALSNI